jgi:hypothetical protein
MKRHGAKQPARWHLGLFIGLMDLVLLGLVGVLPEGYHPLLEGIWATIVILGMGYWQLRYEPAVIEQEQAKRREEWEASRAARWYTEGRSLPLTPTQQRFLEQQEQKNQ